MVVTSPAKPEKCMRREAKKEHRCYWCGGTVSPGEFYMVLEFLLNHLVVLKFHEDCYQAALNDPATLKGQHRRYGQIRGRTVEESRWR